MARLRRIDLEVATLFTNSAADNGSFNIFQWWIDSGSIKTARMGWEVQLESAANMVTRPGYQLANVANTIVSTLILGGDTQTSVGVKYPSGMSSISANSQANQLFRAGLWVKNPLGNTDLNCVRVSAWLEYEEC